MFASDEWIKERAGVHRATVARWRRAQRFPPALTRLAALELEGELGLIHDAWRGWRIARDGTLSTPGGLTYTAAELLALPVRFQLMHELARQRRRSPLTRLWAWLTA